MNGYGSPTIWLRSYQETIEVVEFAEDDRVWGYLVVKRCPYPPAIAYDVEGAHWCDGTDTFTPFKTREEAERFLESLNVKGAQ